MYITPMEKSPDLGSATKCEIFKHILIIPCSQRVGAIETEIETYKILQALNVRTGNKSRNHTCHSCKYLHFYCQSSRKIHGTSNHLEVCHHLKLMSQIDMNQYPKTWGSQFGHRSITQPPQKSAMFTRGKEHPHDIPRTRCF